MRDQSNQIIDDLQALFQNFFIIFWIALTVFLIFTALQWSIFKSFHWLLSFFPDPNLAHESFHWQGPVVLFSSLMLATSLRCYFIKQKQWHDARGDGASEALKYFYDTYSEDTGDEIVKSRYKNATFMAALRRSIATFLTLAPGGSGGLEGPALPIGEAIGAGWSKVFGNHQAPDLRLFQMAGISAGICSLLNMPFMAALFAAEVVYSDKLIYRSFFFSLFSSLAVYFFNTHLISITPLFENVAHSFEYAPLEYAELAIFAIFICAPSGLLVKWLITWMRGKMEVIPLWPRGLIGVCALFLLAMFAYYVLGISIEDVLGMGESTLVHLFDDNIPPELSIWWMLLIILFIKLFATAFTLASGGSAGQFIPAMFMGGLSAASLYYLLVELGLPLIGGGPCLLMVSGVCAALVSVIGVPLAAIAFAFEGFGPEFGPSAIISVVTCYFFMGHFGKAKK